MYVIIGSGFPFMVTGPRFLNTKLSCGWHSRDLQIEKNATDKNAKWKKKLYKVGISFSWPISLHSRCNIRERGQRSGMGEVAAVGVGMEGGICSFPFFLSFLTCPMPYAPCSMPHAPCPVPRAPCPVPYSPPFNPITRDNKTTINRSPDWRIRKTRSHHITCCLVTLRTILFARYLFVCFFTLHRIQSKA